MENTPKSQFKVALTYGVILGLALIICNIIVYSLNISFESWTQWIGTAVRIAIVIIAIKNYRDKELGGFISYGKSLGTGTLIIAIGGFIGALYMFIFITYIDTEYMTAMMDYSAQKLAEQGVPEGEIAKIIERQKEFSNPFYSLLFGTLFSALTGFIISLIISIFMKKKDPAFESNFQ